MATVRVDSSVCDAEKNKGMMIGAAVGAAIAVGGHMLMKKQVPGWAQQGNMMAAKVAGALGVPMMGAWYNGRRVEAECRSKHFGMSPPRATITTNK